MTARIEVHILEDAPRDAPPPDWTARAADCAMSVEPGAADSALSVVIADDATVSDLNRTYRGVDGTTDVLSFSNVHFGEYYGADGDDDMPTPADPSDFILPPGVDAGLGELVISYPQTLRQAAESRQDARAELAALLAHGVLHLLGYDHENARDAALMRSRERAAQDAQRRAGLFG